MTEHLLKPLHPDQVRAARSLAAVALGQADIAAKELNAGQGLVAAGVGAKLPGITDCLSMRGITEYVPGSKVEAPQVVTEGPAMQDPPRDVPSSQMPFAYRLRRSLEQLGAVIGLNETSSHHGMSVSAGAISTQLHMCTDCPEDLAAEIFRRFGPYITFGTLTIPRSLEFVSWSRSGQVWVRHVIDYHVGSDTRIQRWDVLVRKT